MFSALNKRGRNAYGRLPAWLKRKRTAVPLALLLGGAALVGGRMWLGGNDFIASLPGVGGLLSADAPTHEGDFLGFSSPLSVAVSRDGATGYVVEGSGDRLVKQISLVDGSVVRTMLPPRTSPGTRNPVAVAVGADGNVYVVDRTRAAVDIYDPAGNWLGLLSPPADVRDWEPLGVDEGNDGLLYVTNTGAGGPVVVAFTSDGTATTALPTVSADGLPVSFPAGTTVDGNGRLIVSDSNNSRLIVLEPGQVDGLATGASAATHQLGLPRGLVYDASGRLLVADATDHTVAGWDMLSSPPRFLYTFGTEGIEDGAFLFPNDVALTLDGEILVADRDNNRVQLWNP